MGRALAIGKLNKFRIFMKRALSMICVTVILIIGLCYCNQLFIRKDSYRQCEPFYNSSQEFDVLLFGSSHVWNGISPLLLYRDYGITSYNLAAPGNYIPSNYYRLQEILKFLKRENRQLPKVIVLDVFAGKDSAYWLHLGWDDFSFSANKIKMVDALLDEKDRAAMMFPFFLYHSRWNELGKDDFRTDTNKFYGMARGNYELSYPEKEIISNPSDRISADAETVGYLEQIKEECEATGIKLILIHIPYSYRPDLQRIANGICQYADEQGILCVNYMNMDIELDHEIDFCDPGHLNPTGMRIMTDELGKLLTGAGVEDHRGGAQSAQWEQACEEYIDFRVEKLTEIKSVKPYLMALNDPDLISTVRIQEAMLGDVQISKLLDRLREEGNRIVITDEQIEMTSENGQAKKYNVYCEVYRRSNSETAVHTAGFTF